MIFVTRRAAFPSDLSLQDFVRSNGVSPAEFDPIVMHDTCFGRRKMDESEEFWNKASKNYDSTEERFEVIHSRARDKTKEHLEATDSMLDYGCGTGTKSCELADQVSQILAIDISAEMIELAKAKGDAHSIENVRFERATIFDEKLEANSFDVVTAFNMLHTVPEPRNVVNRIHEVLKPDGLFVSLTPCMAEKKSFSVGLQISVFRILSKLGFVPISFEIYRSSDVDDLMCDGGFQTVESESIFAGASSHFVAARKAGQRDETIRTTAWSAQQPIAAPAR